MNALLKFVASLLLILQMSGCANAPVAVQPAVPAGATIAVIGFVKTPGSHVFHDGMTVADALAEAGGYDRCSSCQKFYDENGWHPTFDQPPKVQRAGKTLQLPKTKAEWRQFTLQPEDEIEFRHIMW